MLILGRRVGDSILIDGGIRIIVLACDRRGVRLGIEAPPEVTILRGEIVNQIADENRRAGATPGARDWLRAIPPKPGSGKREAGSEGSGESERPASEEPGSEKREAGGEGGESSGEAGTDR